MGLAVILQFQQLKNFVTVWRFFSTKWLIGELLQNDGVPEMLAL